MEEQKKETQQKEENLNVETERDFKALRTIFRGLGMSRIFTKKQEDMAIARLYRLYLKAKGEYDPNKKKASEDENQAQKQEKKK